MEPPSEPGDEEVGDARGVLLGHLLHVEQDEDEAVLGWHLVPQPTWPNDGVRVEQIQMRMQAAPPALLHSIVLWNHPFVLRELQPTQDKLNLDRCRGRVDRLTEVVRCMGQITAWSQLGRTGRDGSASTDDLIYFARNRDWQVPLVGYAKTYRAQIEADYREYCQEFQRYAMERHDG